MIPTAVIVLLTACISIWVGAGLGYHAGYTDASEERAGGAR